jgi:surfactin synthase thioesterase subunit
VIGSRVRWLRSPQGWVRHLCLDADRGPSHGTAVIIPGLGLPRYMTPLSRELALRGWDVVVVDALAARPRRGSARVAPTIGGIARATAYWLGTADLRPPVVVVGHSTGAQVALEVVLAVQDRRPQVALVMAGPTFTPAQRRLHRLLPAALAAYRKDTPKELVVLKDLARVRTDVVRVVRSGLRHHLEHRMPVLRVPVTVTAGEADSFAPAPWLDRLAQVAGGPSRVEVLPGSHNNVFPHAAEVAALVVSAPRV